MEREKKTKTKQNKKTDSKEVMNEGTLRGVLYI